MKIISTVHKLLLFKKTDPIYLGHKDLKKIFEAHTKLKKLSEYADN